MDLLLARVREQLRAQQIDLEVTQEAKDHIIKLGYDADYGARPLRRVIQNMVEDPLAEALLLGRYAAGQTIVVDRSPDAGLTIEPLAEKTPVEAALGRVARPESRYVCQACGAVSARWEGRCHVCGAWDSLVETLAAPASRGARRAHGRTAVIGRSPPRPLRERRGQPAGAAPRASGIAEVDRVLGGGLVPGALVLLGGEPGIGKSTLVLEIAAGVAARPRGRRRTTRRTRAVRHAARSRPTQLHLRADRLGLIAGPPATAIQVLAATALEAVLAAAEAARPACSSWTRSRR